MQVEPELTPQGHPEVFVLGDLASIHQQNGQPVPGVAPAAIQMGQFAAATIVGDLQGMGASLFLITIKGVLPPSAAHRRLQTWPESRCLAGLLVHLAFRARAVPDRLPQSRSSAMGMVLGLSNFLARSTAHHRTKPLDCPRRNRRSSLT